MTRSPTEGVLQVMKSLRVARFPRMLVAFYVLGIVLIDVVTGGATPSVDGYDLRLAFA